MNEPPAIEVRDLRKRYGELEAVRGIDIAVRAARSSACSAPTARARRRRWRSWRATARATAARWRCSATIPALRAASLRQRIGHRAAVGRHLQPHHPARGPAPLGRLLPRARATSRRCSRSSACRRRADARSRTLSGGQLRRLDFALALVGDPELIFLDEPTTGFDPEARRAAWETIRSLRALGKTILLTTHYLDEAQALADRVAIVKDGRVLAIGPPRELGVGASHYRVAYRDGAGRARGARDRRPHARCCTTLTAEALARGERLEELSVGRPSLEDVYLELTADA